MGSRKRSSVSTKQEALELVQEHLDLLSTLQASVIRMHFGLTEGASAAVGDPPDGCDRETSRMIRKIEDQVLDRVRGSSEPPSVKTKIVENLKKNNQ